MAKGKITPKQKKDTKEDSVIPAKTCFGHIGGKLGQLLLEQFADKGWIAKKKLSDKHFYITETGQVQFKKLGIDLGQVKKEKELT